MLSDTRYQRAWFDYVRHVRGNDRQGLPRYGLLTLTARRTPFYLYDHPDLLKVAGTAFTEGRCVYMALPYFIDLVQEERLAANRSQSVVPVMLHEVMHKLLNHVFRSLRLADVSEHKIMNIAQDTFMNMRILRGYEKAVAWGFPFLDGANQRKANFYGVSDKEIELYWNDTEEIIFRKIRRDLRAMAKSYMQGYGDAKSGTAPQGPSISVPVPGEAGGEPHPSMTPEKGYEAGYADAKAGKAPQTQPKSDKHTMTPGDLRDLLEKAGLKDVADKLNLPKKGDKKAHEDLGKEERQLAQEDLGQAKSLQKRSGGKMAGPHIEDAVATELGQLYKPRIGWRLALREIILGNGDNRGYSDALPDHVYYLDPGELGVADPIYDGMMLPTENDVRVLVIIDTSGSVSDETLRAFFSEAFGLVREDTMNAPQLVIFSADTALRGEPLDVSPDDWEEKVQGIKAYGRGGTTFTGPITSALTYAGERDWRVGGLVYFTDTYASAPARRDLPEVLPPVVFMGEADPGRIKQFQSEVAEYASVYEIEEAARTQEEIVLGPRV
ncbi:MAG: hypothetical protein CVV05_01150 [Gammaproteobacteria bacterium HGW-Gammaproteobacteria-1]|nr:MAG: hypothetical protein CVV05_01150 [Gammaproteobacteria bacterium HGW-Gammaproteobacteria-1]